MLCILVLNTTCPLYLYFNKRAEQKKSMFAWLKKTDAAAFCVSLGFNTNASGVVNDNDFAWETPQKEFIYQGCLYDVISTCVQNQKLYIQCIPDRQEDKLVAQMQNIMHKDKTDKSSPYQHLLKSFLALYVMKLSKPEPLQQSRHTIDHTIYTCYYPSGFSQLNTPPPKLG